MEIIDFNNLLWDLVRDISSNMDSIFQPVCDKYGLTPMQVRILVDIKCDEHTIGSLGRNLCIAGGNISAICRKLEKDDFITRFRDKSDERIVKVHLSQRGLDAVQDFEKYIETAYYPILKAASHEDLHNIIRGLRKLNSLLIKLRGLDNIIDGV